MGEIDEDEKYMEAARRAHPPGSLGKGPMREFLQRHVTEREGHAVALLGEGLYGRMAERAGEIGVPVDRLIESALREWLEGDELLSKFENMIRAHRAREGDESAA